jgi:hypothetical protein
LNIQRSRIGPNTSLGDGLSEGLECIVGLHEHTARIQVKGPQQPAQNRLGKLCALQEIANDAQVL